MTIIYLCYLFSVVSKPTDCIFPYDFVDAVKKKVSLTYFAQKHERSMSCNYNITCHGLLLLTQKRETWCGFSPLVEWKSGDRCDRTNSARVLLGQDAQDRSWCSCGEFECFVLSPAHYPPQIVIYFEYYRGFKNIFRFLFLFPLWWFWHIQCWVIHTIFSNSWTISSNHLLSHLLSIISPIRGSVSPEPSFPRC